MLKVLVITYLPYASPRIPGLAKYLPEFGWEPIIMTPSHHREPGLALRIVETPYRDAFGWLKRLLGIKPDADDIRKEVKARFGINSRQSLVDFILNAGGAILNYPDSERGWKPFAVKVGDELLQGEDIGAVISSSSPVTSHLIARELKTRHKIPWLADLRDLWSQNHNYRYGPLRRLIDRRLEVKTLSRAEALVTVSEPWAEKLGILHKGKPAHVITNGFDPAETGKGQLKLTSRFTITHTGSIYPGKQDPARLLAVLQELISEGAVKPDDIEVRFYGEEMAWLSREIEQYGLSGIVKQYGMLPRRSAIEKQRESQLLLLLDWDDPREKGVYTGKVFEYLGAHRPILATGGSDGDVVDELLTSTKAGVHALTVEQINSALNKFYGEYKRKGEVAYNGEESKLSQYSHREMARRFAEVLDHLAAK